MCVLMFASTIFSARDRKIRKKFIFSSKNKEDKNFFARARALLFLTFFSPHPGWKRVWTGKFFGPRRPKNAINHDFPGLRAPVAIFSGRQNHRARKRTSDGPCFGRSRRA